MRDFITWVVSYVSFACMVCAGVDEYRHFGDFELKQHFKISGGKVIQVPIKPITFHVYTDGMRIRVSADGDHDAFSVYEIYRSDGMTHQRAGEGALEVIPGIQALSRSGGVLRHMRLSTESMTTTHFPGISDQTIVSHALAVKR
jgi:hypothetical protein